MTPQRPVPMPPMAPVPMPPMAPVQMPVPVPRSNYRPAYYPGMPV